MECRILSFVLVVDHSPIMGKRATALGPKVKSKGSHKTAKRLAIKKTMLETRAAKKKVAKKK
jgi:hypothetical protein